MLVADAVQAHCGAWGGIHRLAVAAGSIFDARMFELDLGIPLAEQRLQRVFQLKIGNVDSYHAAAGFLDLGSRCAVRRPIVAPLGHVGEVLNVARRGQHAVWTFERPYPVFEGWTPGRIQ